jgi:hypothetical protein
VSLVATGMGLGRHQRKPRSFALRGLSCAPHHAKEELQDYPGEQNSNSNGGGYGGGEKQRCEECGHRYDLPFLFSRDLHSGHVHRLSIPV